MSKKKPQLHPGRTHGLAKGVPVKYAERLLEEEIIPAIRALKKNDVEEGIKKSLKKYLIISLVSTLEYFCKSQVKQYVDKYDVINSHGTSRSSVLI
jgi:hypothetical protein